MIHQWRQLAGLVALGAASLAVAGCGGGSTPTTASAEIHKIGSSPPFDSMNPLAAGSLLSANMIPTIYPKACRFDPGVQPKPDFATKWETSDDGRVWTLTTQPDATWSDGKPLTAEDVAFTYTVINEYTPKGVGGFYGGQLIDMKSATAPDDTTVEVTFKKPIAAGAAYDAFCLTPILPKHVFEPLEGGDGTKFLDFKNVPAVSGGPFVLTSFTKDEGATFERNENYYGTKPRVARLGIQVFSNPDAMVSALRTGEIDQAVLLPGGSAAALQKQAGIVVETNEELGFGIHGLWFNLKSGKPKRLALQDPQVREAIDLAIDRDSITRVARNGFAAPGGSVVPPALSRWVDPEVAPVHDPARANEILDAAGYPKGSDGVRVDSKHGDEELAFTFMDFSHDAGATPTFKVIRNSLEEIGIKLTERRLDISAALSIVTESKDWDMVYGDTGGGFDVGTWLGKYACRQGGWFTKDYTGYCSKEYDALYDQQSAATDEEARLGYVHEMQRMIQEARPVLQIDYSLPIAAYRDNWTGISLMPDGTVSFGSPQMQEQVGPK